MAYLLLEFTIVGVFTFLIVLATTIYYINGWLQQQKVSFINNCHVNERGISRTKLFYKISSVYNLS